MIDWLINILLLECHASKQQFVLKLLSQPKHGLVRHYVCNMLEFSNNQEQLSHIIKDLLNLNSRLHILSSFQFHLIWTEFHSLNVIFIFLFRISSTNSLSLLFSDAGRFWNTMLDWILNSSFRSYFVSSSFIWLRASSSLSFVSSSFLFIAVISSSKSFLTFSILKLD